LIEGRFDVSELSHALAGGKPSRRGPAHVSRAPSFAELVYAHYDWWRDRTAPENGSAKAYHEALTSYQHHHGEVVSAYWCTHVESGAALTEKKRALPWATPVCTFHRESDWATKHAPDIARELHRCDELAVRARVVLKGVRQSICLRLVMSSTAHLLSLVDARAAHADEESIKAALEQERDSLKRANEYYTQAANGQAQIVYFVGMVVVAIAISVIAGLFLAFDEWAPAVAAAIAGAAGAVISVVQRINDGHFELEYDVGRPYAFFLGGLRPVIGAAMAVVIASAFASGIMHLPISSDASAGDTRFALIVISFLAGFSERWAQDTLAAAVPASKEPAAKPAGS